MKENAEKFRAKWGAAEVALALQASGVPKGLEKRSAASYLRAGSLWASRYIRAQARGQSDTLNLYDDSAIAKVHTFVESRNGNGNHVRRSAAFRRAQ